MSFFVAVRKCVENSIMLKSYCFHSFSFVSPHFASNLFLSKHFSKYFFLIECYRSFTLMEDIFLFVDFIFIIYPFICGIWKECPLIYRPRFFDLDRHFWLFFLWCVSRPDKRRSYAVHTMHNIKRSYIQIG